MPTSAPILLLASASPRRRQLATLLGLPVRIVDGTVDEPAFHLPDPMLAALNVAREKARVGLAASSEDGIVLGADTVVIHQDGLLGKPSSPEDARRMLESLSNGRHYVTTGVSLLCADGREWAGLVTTTVHMRRLADTDIQRYIERGEPFDKAGGYAVQDQEFRPVKRWDGCYLNVVGLPLCAAQRGLETLGVPVPAPADSMLPPCAYCARGASLVAVTAS